MNKFYAMDAAGASADVYIFGDVTSIPWTESDVAAHTFTTDLANLGAVSDITCHISSYGGEVEEDLAIFNALLAHPAHVTTICEGQACSIASVIFMVGDDRIMREASALFIHDCWTMAQGDADDLRKIADALDAQMLACKAAYMRGGIDVDALDALLKADSWLSPEMAVEHGFATSIDADAQDQLVAASAHKAAFDRIFAKAESASEPAPANASATELPAYADAFAELVAALVQEIRSMNDELNIPQGIKNYGKAGVIAETSIIDYEEFETKKSEVAANALLDACTGSNPRIPAQQEMEQLLECVYLDKDVDF